LDTDEKPAFEKILENDQCDLYSLLALGNIYYAAKFDKKEKEERFLKLAMSFYWKALQLDSSNIYASNGVALIFAEKGNLLKAKKFLIQAMRSVLVDR